LIPVQGTPYNLNKNSKNSGLFPSTFNVATKADIYVNATCGEEGPETFCKPSESSRCAVCDARSPDLGKRHNISNVLDSNPARWWQSPTLTRGDRYEYVTISLDLKQVKYFEMINVHDNWKFLTEFLLNEPLLRVTSLLLVPSTFVRVFSVSVSRKLVKDLVSSHWIRFLYSCCLVQFMSTATCAVDMLKQKPGKREDDARNEEH
jgi:laminin alpha 1/2